MTVFAETLTFDFAHTALVLVSVPVFVGLAAAAFSFVRGLNDRSFDLVFGSRGTAPMWDVRHSRLRHRRPTWMTDRGTKWIVRRKRPERNQSADPSYLSHQ